MASSSTRRSSGLASIGLVLVVVLGVWLSNGGDPGSSTGRAAPSATPSGIGRFDPGSGLPYVAVAQLPPEAATTVQEIDDGAPYDYDEDGGTFGNYEGLLPHHDQGYYEEFTVPTPGSRDRGARRIIRGDDGTLYWTGDHYASFQVIRR